MRLAITFDDLIQFGGAERLLLAIHEIWPEAPVYTTVASEKWLGVCAYEKIDLRTSFLQKFPKREKLNRIYATLFLHNLAFESFDFSEHAVVLSISSRFAHGIITKPSTKHICYMNSPGRMFWEPVSYFEKEQVSSGWLSPFLCLMRLWDFAASHRVDYFIANSKTPQKRIKKYYGRNSDVIYPFVEPLPGSPKASDEGFFLVITRLAPWKKVDIAVRACLKLGLPLKVIGDGPDFSRLSKLAEGYENIELLGFVSEKEKWELLRGCTALIQTQHEDFGIVPLEALSCGKPVIAYGKGGVLETVVDGRTGEFFYEQTPESLLAVLKSFDASKYKPQICMESTAEFSKDIFQEKIKSFVENSL